MDSKLQSELKIDVLLEKSVQNKLLEKMGKEERNFFS
jgi:hypothetical protein